LPIDTIVLPNKSPANVPEKILRDLLLMSIITRALKTSVAPILIKRRARSIKIDSIDDLRYENPR
jgi:hypothetical protein